MKRRDSMQRLTPLLDAVRTAPMDQSYKDDMSLLVTECLIRAIEARTSGAGKDVEQQRQALVEKSVQQGYILTAYFYEELAKFEKGPAGFKDAYTELLNGIDVRREAKRANNVAFADAASPDVLFLPPRRNATNLLGSAENRLAAGDPQGAQTLAQQALDDQSGDPGRALFILAQVATMNKDINGARTYFQQALGVAKEPQVVAWSHIYLGRIFDLQEDRDSAVDEYRAALAAANALPEAKAAAEKGLQQPYEPPARPQTQQ
jgi:tetratricopeptide (TPR) repeat protein